MYQHESCIDKSVEMEAFVRLGGMQWPWTHKRSACLWLPRARIKSVCYHAQLTSVHFKIKLLTLYTTSLWSDTLSLYFLFNLTCMLWLYACLCAMYIPGAQQGQKKKMDPLGIGVTKDCCPLRGCCKQNLGPLQEQQLLLTTEHLSSPCVFFLTENNKTVTGT